MNEDYWEYLAMPMGLVNQMKKLLSEQAEISRLFKNPNSIFKALQCSICIEVFENPRRVDECGHTFCDFCLENWMMKNQVSRKEAVCPLCKSKIDKNNISIDFIAQNIICDF